jgi:predicted Zn-dependent protease
VGGRTFWRALGKELATLVEELSDRLETYPRVARALVEELAAVEGPAGARARAIAAWRGGSADDAWAHVEPLLSGRSGKGDVQLLAARIRHAQGHPALATKLLKAVLANTPKKGTLREQAEAQLAAWSSKGR